MSTTEQLHLDATDQDEPTARTADYAIVHRIVDGQKESCGRIDFDVWTAQGEEVLRRYGPGEYQLDFRARGRSGSRWRETVRLAAPHDQFAGSSLESQMPVAPVPATSDNVLTVMLGMFNAQQQTMSTLLTAMLSQKQESRPASEIESIVNLAERLATMKEPEGALGGIVGEAVRGVADALLQRTEQKPPPPPPIPVPVRMRVPLPRETDNSHGDQQLADVAIDEDLIEVAPKPDPAATHPFESFVAILRATANVEDREPEQYATILIDIIGPSFASIVAEENDAQSLADRMLQSFPDLYEQKDFVLAVASSLISEFDPAEQPDVPSHDAPVGESRPGDDTSSQSSEAELSTGDTPSDSDPT